MTKLKLFSGDIAIELEAKGGKFLEEGVEQDVGLLIDLVAYSALAAGEQEPIVVSVQVQKRRVDLVFDEADKVRKAAFVKACQTLAKLYA